MNNLKNKKNTNKDKGFVVLIAVLVSGLLITIGIFIANIAIKEISLSNSSKDSQKAFYAADSAAECILYQDIKVRQFATSSLDTGFPLEILCNNELFAVEDISRSPNSGVSIVRISFIPHAESGLPRPGPDNYPFAIVSIEKTDIGTLSDQTVIKSRGFNIKRNSDNRVERSIQINY